MLGWVVAKVKASMAESARRDAEAQAKWAEIVAIKRGVFPRFDRLYFVPDSIRSLPGYAKIINYEEDRWDLWQGILEEFPVEPRTQTEATSNEAKFWRDYAERFTTTDAHGRETLFKHADIGEFYEIIEKWILRKYFAATGKVIHPWVRTYSRARIDADAAERYGKNCTPGSHARNEVHRTALELERVIESKEAHFEKWREWFVSHIQDAFDQMHQKPMQRGQPLADGGMGNLREMRAQATPKPGQGRAQSQTFKD